MPYQTYWMDENRTVVVAKYIGRWTWNDYYTSLDEIDALVEQVSSPADFVLDLSQSDGFPPGNVMTHVKYAANRFSEGQFVNMAIVGPNAFVRIISDVFRKIYRRDQLTGNTFMCKDMAEAAALLESYRVKIGS